MNQRRSRGDNPKNNLDFVSLNMGGLTARHSANEDPQVQTPQKVTGEIKPVSPPLGTAKASPNFKPIAPVSKTLSESDEKKAIAENSTQLNEEKNEAKE